MIHRQAALYILQVIQIVILSFRCTLRRSYLYSFLIFIHFSFNSFSFRIGFAFINACAFLRTLLLNSNYVR